MILKFFIGKMLSIFLILQSAETRRDNQLTLSNINSTNPQLHTSHEMNTKAAFELEQFKSRTMKTASQQESEEEEIYIEEVSEVRKLKNTIENLIRKMLFFITIYLFNASSGHFNFINILDYGMLGMRGILAFVQNSTLEKLYQEFLPIYITITLFRVIIGNAMSLTNMSTCLFTGSYSMWQYGAVIAAIFIVPVVICYLLKEGENFRIRRKIHKAILVGICFYYSFFVFSPLSSLMAAEGGVVPFDITSILDLSYLVQYVCTLLVASVPPHLIKALATLIKCIVLFISTFFTLKIYECVININSSNIFEIVWQFYFGDSVDWENKTVVVKKRKTRKALN